MRRVGLLGAILLCGALGLGGCATGGSEAERFDGERRARAHYSVGVEHLREGRSALAIREFLAAESLQPDDPWIQLSLAEAFRLRGRDEDSEQRLRKALSMNPDLQPARLNLSALYVQTGRHELAIAETRRLLDDPTFPVPWKALANQGWAEYKLGRTGDARRSLELALEYHPEFWPAKLSLAVLDADQGRRLEAIQGLEQVLQEEPGPLAEAEANYRLAEIYISLGNRRKAVKHFTAARATEPSGEWGKRSAEYLERLR